MSPHDPASDLQTAAPTDPKAEVLWIGALAGLGLSLLKWFSLRPITVDATPSEIVRLFLQGIWQDWLLLTLVIGLSVIPLMYVKRRMVGRIIGVAYTVSIALILFWSAANITALRMLGSPVTANWLAYSDIANTDVIFDSLPHVASVSSILSALVLVAVVIVGGHLLARWGVNGARRILQAYVVTVVAGFSVATPPVTGSEPRLANPVFALVQSIGQDPTPDALIDPSSMDITALPFASVPGLPRPPKPVTPIRNVLFYAYESTPASQTQGWDGPFDVTPNLAAAASNGIAFDRAYAHVPASNYFLVSAFSGIVPELSGLSMTVTGGVNDLPSLPSVLNAAGMRSAWFNSADNRFQDTEGFVSAIGFQHVVDYRDWECETGVFEVRSAADRFRNTSSDLCTVDQMKLWIDQDPSTPFFLAFRTGMTHYPYFPGETPQQYVEDPAYNRYLNALRVGDEAFGELLEHLKERELIEETLIVVMGDHGEAFGEHGTYVHASGIYDENVRVPFALINPQLFSGSRTDLVVGLSDAAATVTDLLGLETPREWQGVSIFAPERPGGTIFFAPWNGFQVGFREGDRKFIANANSGRVELYDLGTDPQERNDLGETQPEALENAQRTLSRAIGAHKAHMDAILSDEPLPLPGVRQTEVIITASGTAFGEPPRGQVLLDGDLIGEFEVTSAPDTSQAKASRDLIDEAFMDIHVPIELQPCSKQLEVRFMNDKWAGEGMTGDIDMLLRRIQVGSRGYGPIRFTPTKQGIGGWDYTDFRFYRKGGVVIGIDLAPACLTAALDGGGVD